MTRTLFICIFCLIAVGCSTRNLPPLTDPLCVAEDEKRIWLRSAEEQKAMDKSGLLYADQELEGYLNSVKEKLLQTGPPPQIPIIIKVIRDPYLNAFALPNGTIYIHTGILSRMRNEAQLATLLAHEIIHCMNRHALRLIRSMKKDADLPGAPHKMHLEMDEVGNVAPLLGATGFTAAVSGYSQVLETEADMKGLSLMWKAGYDPREALELYKTLENELKEERMKEPFFFGSHPRIHERIENILDFLHSFNRSRRTEIKNESLFVEQVHKVVFDNAWLDLRAGRFRIAQKGAERYLAMKSGDSKGHFLLGEIFRQKGKEGDIEKAISCYQKAISIDPFCPEPYKAIGLLYFKRGEVGLAKRSFETCLALSPQLPGKAYLEAYLKQCSR